MKHLFTGVLPAFLAVVLLTGCLQDPDPQPQKPGAILLQKATTSSGDSREFVYNNQGWLTQIKGTGYLALNENQQSTSTPIFDNWGRLAYLQTDGPDLDTENAYFYTADNKLYRLDELINDQLQSYHTFAYDAQKRLATRISFYPGPAANPALRETNKYTYTYNPEGNVTEIKVYQKPDATQDWQLTQTRTYENYDTKVSVAHLTDFLFTPTITLHKNNPGKVTTTNVGGSVHTATYTYDYNAQNLPVKKTTSPSTGTAFTTEYTYLF
ncbi:hypothetical protein [Rufibacter sp. LB8]|uniref:hypothetical protein n=1 Tax=Rufibacter sp. LB8 TaxID=2777781 RepID=UPI00178C2ECC|nr:hypothetical protein [Rufibacter sp. LB8]